MALLSASNLSQSFGADDIFAGIGCRVDHGARIGLVGPNGIGKTSLLRILAGIEPASGGRVHVASGARIGYLRQEAARAFADASGTLWDEMMAAFADLRATEADLAAMEASMAGGDADAELIERYGRVQEAFEHAGGYTFRQRARSVLAGLGLDESAHERRLTELSGGQQTRALLARLLLAAPEILFLDEPTNHLDIAAIEWLEGYLAGWEGALLVVSHDRYFLNRVVNRIWELTPGGIEEYRGNHSDYVGQRVERWANRRRLHAEVKARLEREIDYIRRNIAGQNTRQAKGKLMRIAREVEAIRAGGLGVVDDIRSRGWLQATQDLDMERPSDRVDEVARRIGELREPVGALPEIRIRMRPGKREGDIVMRASGLRVGFEDAQLFETGDIELRRGERAAIIGPNGIGKTTLLRTLIGRHPPLGGQVELGAGVEVGYFAQAHETLDPAATAAAELQRGAGMSEAEARKVLAGFLFSGDDVFKTVGSLSGGERGRLALAILAQQGANLLVLDEPTNHLDIVSQEVLEAVLDAFEGSLLFVTHDRYLVDRLATQIWEVEVGRLRVFDVPYAEYHAARAAESQAGVRPGGGGGGAVRSGGAAGPSGAKTGSASAAGAGPGDAPDLTAPTAAPALSKNELRRRAMRAEALEDEIESLEEQLAELAEDLQRASEAGDLDGVRAADEAYKETRARLDELVDEWTEASA